MGKLVRVSDEVHKLLKVYCADNDMLMSEFVDEVLLEKLSV